MVRADFMGFPFRQDLLMRGEWDGLRFDPEFRLDLCHMTSAPPMLRDPQKIVEEHRRFKALVDRQESPLAAIYGIQNPPEQNVLATWNLLKDAGISISTLAFEMENEYGGGFAAPEAPLTKEGSLMLRYMEDARFTLDLSHAGHRTIRDALDDIEKRGLCVPVVATHVGCHAVCPHLRNLPDDILRRIRDMGGIVGLATFSWMLAEEGNTLEAFFDHLEHALVILGEDAVCLGTDGVYTHINEEEGAKRFSLMNAKLDPRGNYRARWPERAAALNTPQQLEVLHAGIEDRFGAKVADKVAGQNLLRFFCRIF